MKYRKRLNSIFTHRLFSLYYFHIQRLLGVCFLYVAPCPFLFIYEIIFQLLYVYIFFLFSSIPSYSCSTEIMPVLYFFLTVSPPSPTLRAVYRSYVFLCLSTLCLMFSLPLEWSCSNVLHCS